MENNDRELSAHLDSRGLPITAAKGQGKARDPKTSPFVRLVGELQRAFSEGLRAHTINLMRLSRRRSGTLGAATARSRAAQTIGPNRTFEERTPCSENSRIRPLNWATYS